MSLNMRKKHGIIKLLQGGEVPTSRLNLKSLSFSHDIYIRVTGAPK